MRYTSLCINSIIIIFTVRCQLCNGLDPETRRTEA